jgi:REP element-mobilizing transposase RayT
MVLGSHVIFSAYGFWLPNDPRGAWSDFVGAWELFRFGKATKTEERRSVAQRPHDRAAREAAKQELIRPAVQFSGLQAQIIGNGFKNAIEQHGLTIWACSILPEHVHMVIARHVSKVEHLVNWMKGAATRSLLDKRAHPFQDQKDRQGRVPKCWTRGEWKVFLDSVERMLAAIKYVEENPLKEGKPPQRWSFVTPFDPNHFV